MDSGNIWNSLYTSQLMGTQMYGLQVNPFQYYGSYGDIWQNTGFMNTLSNALTKYNQSLPDADFIDVGDDVKVSTHKGNVWQLGYDKSLVYLPGEQKMLIVQTDGTGQSTKNTAAKADGAAGRTRTARTLGPGSIEEKGILVNQRKARASAAYRTTQSAGRRKSIWASDNTGIQ